MADITYITLCPVTGRVGTKTCTFFSTPEFITVNGIKYLWCFSQGVDKELAKDAYQFRMSTIYKPKYLSWFIRFTMKQRGCSSLPDLWSWIDHHTNQGVVECLVNKGYGYEEAVKLIAKRNPNPSITA